MRKNRRRVHVLPPLKEEERIYLNVPYGANGFAKQTHCGFDSAKKLWFTGLYNTYLNELVELYGINDTTTERTRLLLQEKLKQSAGDV